MISVAPYVAVMCMLSSKCNQEEEYKKQKERERQSGVDLLLQGGGIDMEIGSNEKLLSYYIKYTYEYNNTQRNTWRKWVIKLDKEYVTDTLNDMIVLVSNMLHAKGIQIMPMSVSKGNRVDEVLILVKTNIVDNNVLRDYANGIKFDNLGPEW